MDRRIFYAQVKSSNSTPHKSYIIYDLQSSQFKFYKCLSKKLTDLGLLVENFLIQRQRQILDIQRISIFDNHQFLLQNNSSQLTIVTKYIPYLSLQQRQRDLTTNLQSNGSIYDFKVLAKSMIGLLIRGANHLIPTFQNILIDKNQKLYLNYASTVGWRLLLFEQQIQGSEFRQICLFVDKEVFERPISNRIGFHIKQRSLAIILLSFLSQEIFNLPNKLKIPNLVDRKKAIELLLQLDRMMHKFLQIRKIRKKIEAKQKECAINLFNFFETVLIPANLPNQPTSQKWTWSQILRLLFEYKAENKCIQTFVKDLAKNNWSPLDEQKKRFYIQNALFPAKLQTCSWNYQQAEIFLLLHMNEKLQKGFLLDRIQQKEFTYDSFNLNTKIQGTLTSSRQLMIKLQKYQESYSQGRFTFQEKTDKSYLNSLVLAQSKLKKKLSLKEKCQKKQLERSIIIQHQRLQALEIFKRGLLFEENQGFQDFQEK